MYEKNPVKLTKPRVKVGTQNGIRFFNLLLSNIFLYIYPAGKMFFSVYLFCFSETKVSLCGPDWYVLGTVDPQTLNFL